MTVDPDSFPALAATAATACPADDIWQNGSLDDVAIYNRALTAAEHLHPAPLGVDLDPGGIG